MDSDFAATIALAGGSRTCSSSVEVVFDGPDALRRRLARVRITAAGGDGLRGRLEKERAA
jgi:hypothetical protein